MAGGRLNIVLTGAAGQISYALLFRLVSGQVFGMDRPIHLRLLELESSLPRLEGLMMELEDGAFPLLEGMVSTSNVKEAMLGADWVLLVGAVPRKAGMERSDLLAINGQTFKAQGQGLNQYAGDEVRILVVGNPCNTNAYVAMKHAPDIPQERFFAMTMLDELRGRAQLAKRAGVPIEAVQSMCIWGNHSATQFPDFYHATIHNRPALEVIGDEPWLQDIFIPTVQQRGSAVIQARGASSAASAANAIIRTIQAVEQDTLPEQCFSMAICSQGQYGIDKDLIFSFPCRSQNRTISVVEHWQHNDYATARLQQTLQELRQERAMVEKLGLVPKT